MARCAGRKVSLVEGDKIISSFSPETFALSRDPPKPINPAVTIKSRRVIYRRGQKKERERRRNRSAVPRRIFLHRLICRNAFRRAEVLRSVSNIHFDKFALPTARLAPSRSRDIGADSLTSRILEREIPDRNNRSGTRSRANDRAIRFAVFSAGVIRYILRKARYASPPDNFDTGRRYLGISGMEQFDPRRFARSGNDDIVY